MDAAVEDENNWLSRTVDLQTGAERRFPPDSATVAHTGAGSIVTLVVSAGLNKFTETVGGEEVTTLRKKPRHHVGYNFDFMFSGALGISLKYQDGSLPPAFNLVNHSVSVGLTFKLKQANK